MSAVQIGPLVFGIERFAAIAGIFVFLAAVSVVARFRPQVSDRLQRWSGWALMLGLIGGRLGHVAAHWSEFAAEPARILAFWQGGFSVQAGLVVLLVVTGIATGRGPGLMRPAGLTLALGLAVWQGILVAAGPVSPLLAPEMRLATLDGQGFDLAQQRGRPMVLNLWATWCAPCRRELPMMAAVSESVQGVTFAFASQREPPQRVASFLATEGLRLPNVIFDEDGVLGRHYASFGLPATLFIDAEGTLAALHVGEISREALLAGIADLLARQP